MPQGDTQYFLGANDVEVEAPIDVFFPLMASAVASPEVEIAILVACPPLALPFFHGQVVGIDVGVGGLFVDEWHRVGSPGWGGGGGVGGAANTSMLIIPRVTSTRIERTPLRAGNGGYSILIYLISLSRILCIL